VIFSFLFFVVLGANISNMRCIYYSYCYYYYYLQKHEAHVLTPYLEFNTCLSGVSRCSVAAAAAAAAADADSIISFLMSSARR
jgi:hypothetical protein